MQINLNQPSSCILQEKKPNHSVLLFRISRVLASEGQVIMNQNEIQMWGFHIMLTMGTYYRTDSASCI